MLIQKSYSPSLPDNVHVYFSLLEQCKKIRHKRLFLTFAINTTVNNKLWLIVDCCWLNTHRLDLIG